MELHNRKVNTGAMVAVVASVAMLALAGCVSEEQTRPAYLSSDARLVGGGLLIEWNATEAGTAYLVEKQTGKLVQTVSLKSGEAYEFAVKSTVDAQDLGNLIGIDMAKAEFLLYFKPAGQEKSTP